MEITCGACATKLNIPDATLPKNVPVLTGKCPKCQSPIEIRIPQPGAPAPAPEAPPPAPAPLPAPAPAPMVLEDDFVEGQRLAMACFNEDAAKAQIKAELESMGFSVHVPATAEEAVARLRRRKYEVLLLQEEYGGSADKNEVLKTVAPMAMSLRRHMCVGLIGKDFRTMDNMAAFAKSVNFVAAEKELEKIKAITRHAMTDNDQFYAVFRDALKEAGKA